MNNYSIHFYIEGPYEDLVSVTQMLDLSHASSDYSGWEIEGGSAVLHYSNDDCPYDLVEKASEQFPSLKITFRYTYILANVGLEIYEDGKIKLRSVYDWDNGKSHVSHYS